MNTRTETLNYARPGTIRRRRRIARSAFVAAAVVVLAAVAAIIEYHPALLPQTALLDGDRRGIPAMLAWLLAIVYVVQRTREDARWPCAGLVLVAIAGATALSLFVIQCIIWREQLKYGDRFDGLTVWPFTGAAGAFALAAVGRRLANHRI